MSEKTPVLLSMPNLPGLPSVGGSIPRKCTLCTRVLYISVGGAKVLEEGAVPLCPVCASKDVPTDAEAIVTPEIRKEIEDRSGVTPESIMGGIEPNMAVMMLADKILTIEGRIERGEISG